MDELTLNENTYERLKQDIMTFKLVPGDSISAAKIADRYHVSRTPAREAIVKLEREGLLVIYPQAKTLVSKIDLKRASQEWFVRSTMEVGMVSAFLRNCTDKTIALMKDNLRSQMQTHMEVDAATYFHMDNEFHGIIYQTAEKELAMEIIETYMSHYNRIRFLTDLSAELRERTLKEHAAILEAAEERSEELMRALLKKHIRPISNEHIIMKEKYPEYFSSSL